MTDNDKRTREFWILPHEYSCGGYWIAERFPSNLKFHFKGEIYQDDLSFMLLSGRMEVLSQHQVRRCIDACIARGERINEYWEDQLPDGARIQF